MKILITGHRGFIGSHLNKLIPEADGLDIKNGYHEDIRTCNLDKDYTHIFHLAALRSAELGEQYPENFITTNCWGTVRLLKRYSKARFLNVTSASVEDVKGIYGATKKFSELIGSLSPNVINVRPYNVFGEGQLLESNAVIPNFIYCFLNSIKPTIYGEGSQIRDFTYVEDLVREMKRLMFETNMTGTVHAGYNKPISIWELAKMIYGHQPEVVFASERTFDTFYSIAPYSIKQYVGREEGIRRTIEWWRNIR